MLTTTSILPSCRLQTEVDAGVQRTRLTRAVNNLKLYAQQIVDLYARTFYLCIPSPTSLPQVVLALPAVDVAEISTKFSLRIRSLNRVLAVLRASKVLMTTFTVTCGLYYAGGLIADQVIIADGIFFGTSFFPMVAWGDSGNHCKFNVRVSSLPREAYICFSVTGESGPSDKAPAEPIGWVAVSIFDYRGVLQHAR